MHLEKTKNKETKKQRIKQIKQNKQPKENKRKRKRKDNSKCVTLPFDSEQEISEEKPNSIMLYIVAEHRIFTYNSTHVNLQHDLHVIIFNRKEEINLA